MLSNYVIMLGKDANDPCMVEMENFFNDQMYISFNNDGIISKITVPVNSMRGTKLLHSISSTLSQDTDKKNLICVLGEPTYILNFPQTMKKQVILFYGNANFWLGWKFKDNTIETISVMLPGIIPDVIKFGHIPIRICRS